MAILKQLFFLYQDILWFAGHAKGEYAKIGSFIPETISIMIWLKLNGYTVPLWLIPVFYIGVMGLASFIGLVLVRLHVVKYTARLGNSQNPDFMEMKEGIQQIKQYIGISDK